MSPIRVGVCGALGRMGSEVVRTVLNDPDLELVMAIETTHIGEDIGPLVGQSATSVVLSNTLQEALDKTHPHVVVDFTTPHTVLSNAMTVLHAGAYSVIGTTGLSEEAMTQLEAAAHQSGKAVLVAPNFAIGAVLLMKFAQEASHYFDHAEIIELHHNKKLDAPSGTAIRTAQLMREVQPAFGPGNVDDTETLLGARGATAPGNLHIHSVRLPGLVAHQEVIFGGLGQTLTLRHDSLDRTSFMPGVALAVKKIIAAHGLIYGLENLIF